MPSNEVISDAVASAKASLLNVSDAPAMPASLRGRLLAATSKAGQPLSAIGSVAFRAPTEPGKLLRTGAGFLDAVSYRTRAAHTHEELDKAVDDMLTKLRRTGAYKSVSHTLEADAEGAPRLAVTLDELSVSASSGMEASPNTGRVNMQHSASIINLLGCAETMRVRMSSQGGDLAASVDDGNLLSPIKSTDAMTNIARSALAPPNLYAEVRKPSISGTSIGAFARARREWDSHEATAGINIKLVEGEMGITDENGHHSLAAIISLRQPVPFLRPDAKFASAVSASIASQCSASTKHSILYSFANNHLRPSAAAPASGYAAKTSLEFAGLGGDVRFGKVSLSGTLAASLGRFTPDTGYALPIIGDKISEHHHSSHLSPSPGTGIFRWWTGGGLHPLGSKSADRHSSTPILSTFAGWLSPGVTAVIDGFAGALIPWGGTLKGQTSLFPDRFHSNTLRLRGFSSIGNRGETVERGLPSGDALGGDFAAVISARLVLPPPIPSVMFSNSGARSYAFTSVSALALTNSIEGGGIAKHINYCGGVGVVSFILCMYQCARQTSEW
jgi:hypothetical protein